MRYKVEFEDNIPMRAFKVKSKERVELLTDFSEVGGKTCIKFLYVDAESETDAISQARRVVTTIFKF
jgi:hypothetical protein